MVDVVAADLVLVLFAAGCGTMAWLLAQAGLFIGIAVVRVLLEDRECK